MRDVVTFASWADKELKAYRQVDLAPGQTHEVAIEVPVADCTIVEARGECVVEPRPVDLLIGPSSRDAALLGVRFEVA